MGNWGGSVEKMRLICLKVSGRLSAVRLTIFPPSFLARNCAEL